MRYIARPRNGTVPGQQLRKISAHTAVHGRGTRVCFLQNGINRDFTVHIRKLHDGHIHDQRDLSAAGDRNNRLGWHIAGILQGHISARAAACRLDVLGCNIRFIPEGLAAEVHRK